MIFLVLSRDETARLCCVVGILEKILDGVFAFIICLGICVEVCDVCFMEWCGTGVFRVDVFPISIRIVLLLSLLYNMVTEMLPFPQQLVFETWSVLMERCCHGAVRMGILRLCPGVKEDRMVLFQVDVLYDSLVREI